MDEVVSKAPTPLAGSGMYLVRDMGRAIGYERRKDPVTGAASFSKTNSVTLIVTPENCNGVFRSRNEVSTMYPGAPSGQ